MNKGSSTGFLTAVKTTVNQAAASVTGLATGSVPRPSTAVGSHHSRVYSENYDNNLKRIKQGAVQHGVPIDVFRPTPSSTESYYRPRFASLNRWVVGRDRLSAEPWLEGDNKKIVSAD